ncbi:MAG: hypothetical protein P4L67_03065 [Candidatus Pacebacteria bacterium]|nr:hypothetical protein [Candidatus Paceibacterota bacterium]
MQNNDSFRAHALRNFILLAALVIIIAAGAFLFWRSSKGPAGTAPTSTTTTATFDPLNAAYVIDGTAVGLTNGSAEQDAAPGSAEKISTKIFGQPVIGDINGDGRNDAAVIVTQSGGGSGTFYYAAAALDAGNGTASGTNAIFLGDRIAPDTMQIANGVVTVNYADRTASEPMSAAPSVGVSKYLVAAGGTLYDVPVGDLYPLASGIAWGDMSAATIAPGEQNVPGPVAGIKIVSQPITGITDLSAPSAPFESYYKKKLAAAGWTVDNSLAAGGPGADITGYKKGNNYVILEYTSVFKNNGGGTAPESCPCDLTFSIFAGTSLLGGQ